jgi:hypothetical protein
MLVEHGFLTISRSYDMSIKSKKRRSLHRVYCLGCGKQMSRLSVNKHVYDAVYHHERLPVREQLQRVHVEMKRAHISSTAHDSDHHTTE